MLFSYTALLALCGAFLLIGVREVLHRRWLKTGGDLANLSAVVVRT